MKKLATYTIVLISTALTLNAQPYSTIEDVDVLKKHEEVLKQYYPQLHGDIQIQEVYKIDDKHSLVKFEGDKEEYQVVLNSARKDMLLVSKYHRISKEETPDIVIDRLNEEEYASWTLEACYEVQEPHSEQYYALEISNEEKTKKLHFNHLGQYRESPY